MENKPKTVSQTLTTSSADVYTCPSSTVAAVTFMQGANSSTSTTADLTVTIYRAATSTSTTLLKGATVGVGSNQAVMAPGQRLMLQAGDKIQALASAGSAIDFTLSVVEKS